MVARFELYRDDRGEWRWRFLNEHDEVLAISPQSFLNQPDCRHAIRTITKACQEAPVVEA